MITATPATLAAILAAPAPVAPAVRLAYRTSTGDAPRPAARPEPIVLDPYCFVCSRATDHFAEHDDLVEAGLALYGRDGAVYDLR